MAENTRKLTSQQRMRLAQLLVKKAGNLSEFAKLMFKVERPLTAGPPNKSETETIRRRLERSKTGAQPLTVKTATSIAKALDLKNYEELFEAIGVKPPPSPVADPIKQADASAPATIEFEGRVHSGRLDTHQKLVPLSSQAGPAETADQSSDALESSPLNCELPQFDDRVIQRFVGGSRDQDVQTIVSVVRRQKIGQKSRPTPGTSLFWYHGFGGMGKSWLLRRLAYAVSRRRAGKETGTAVLLVDWYPSSDWNPLGRELLSPDDVFEGIAARATQVFKKDRELFRPFWDALCCFRNTKFPWKGLYFTRLINALSAAEAYNPSGGESSVGQERTDRDALIPILKVKKLWDDDHKTRVKLLAAVKGLCAERDQVFEAWAPIVAGAGMSNAKLVFRPFGELADILRDCLVTAAKSQSIFLLLDTCEQLTEWTDHWLRKLLTPLLKSSTPIVAVFGARSRPDRYMLPGHDEGWLEELVGRIKPVAFDRGRRFAIEEIEDLLAKSKASVSGISLRDLARRLHTVTRGVPLGLGLVVDKYPDLLKKVAELDAIAADELGESEAARRINEELAGRYLSYVKEVPRDHTDILILALLPGTSSEDEDLLYFQYRLWAMSLSQLPVTMKKLRDRILAAVWDSGWRHRLRELEKSYGLLADGDLHSEIRRSLRSLWRDSPPQELPAVVNRLFTVLDGMRPV